MFLNKESIGSSTLAVNPGVTEKSSSPAPVQYEYGTVVVITS